MTDGGAATMWGVAMTCTYLLRQIAYVPRQGTWAISSSIFLLKVTLNFLVPIFTVVCLHKNDGSTAHLITFKKIPGNLWMLDSNYFMYLVSTVIDQYFKPQGIEPPLFLQTFKAIAIRNTCKKTHRYNKGGGWRAGAWRQLWFFLRTYYSRVPTFRPTTDTRWNPFDTGFEIVGKF